MISLESAFEQAIQQQRQRLHQMGRALMPSLTEEDLLQPNDYEVLETHPLFRYEEGVLEGLLSARALLLAEAARNGGSLRPCESR
jgi:hypothetical protein